MGLPPLRRVQKLIERIAVGLQHQLFRGCHCQILQLLLRVGQQLVMLPLGGGIGNLIDRVLNGEVVDYINLLFMRFAVFNFADICVCVGVALWVLVIFLEELHEDTKKGPKEQ